MTNLKKLKKENRLYLTKKRFAAVVSPSTSKKFRKGYFRSAYNVKNFGDNFKISYAGDSCYVRPTEISQFRHYDKKLEQSITRAKRTILEKAMCNDWDFFFTGTIDADKMDRFNLDQLHKELTKFFRYKDCEHEKVQFLLVPEKHKNGGWHFHGLLKGLHMDDLIDFKYLYKQKYDTLPYYILKKIHDGKPIYDYPRYSDKFGFCDIEPITSHDAVSKYITKYCNKELAARAGEIGKHLYFCSRGLKKSESVAKFDIFSRKNFSGDFALSDDPADALRPDAFPDLGWHDFFCTINGSEIFLGSTATVTPVQVQSFTDRFKTSHFGR